MEAADLCMGSTVDFLSLENTKATSCGYMSSSTCTFYHGFGTHSLQSTCLDSGQAVNICILHPSHSDRAKAGKAPWAGLQSITADFCITFCKLYSSFSLNFQLKRLSVAVPVRGLNYFPSVCIIPPALRPLCTDPLYNDSHTYEGKHRGKEKTGTDVLPPDKTTWGFNAPVSY